MFRYPFSDHIIVVGLACLDISYIPIKFIANAQSRNEKQDGALIPGDSTFCDGCYGTIDIIIKEFEENNLFRLIEIRLYHSAIWQLGIAKSR